MFYKDNINTEGHRNQIIDDSIKICCGFNHSKQVDNLANFTRKVADVHLHFSDAINFVCQQLVLPATNAARELFVLP